jgi:hypothetical protein
MAYHPHTGFHYRKLLTCLVIMAALAIFQAWIWVGFVIDKFLFVCMLKTLSPRKLHILGACLHLADFLFHCVPVMYWIL